MKSLQQHERGAELHRIFQAMSQSLRSDNALGAAVSRYHQAVVPVYQGAFTHGGSERKIDNQCRRQDNGILSWSMGKYLSRLVIGDGWPDPVTQFVTGAEALYPATAS